MSNTLRTALMMAVAGKTAPAPPPGPSTYTFTLTLDRDFGGVSFAWGPVRDNQNNWDPMTYVHNGANFEIWQVIPFIDTAHGSPGDCRIQFRNRDIARSANTVEMMPNRLTITRAEWTDSPWTFTRGSKAGEPGGEPAARIAVNYTPDRVVTGAGVTNGVSDGDEFTLVLEYD